MKPIKSILDESFTYIPSTATAVDATWRRYGWQPVTDQDRKNRRRRPAGPTDARVVELKTLRSA
jgi:hypothetical protein